MSYFFGCLIILTSALAASTGSLLVRRLAGTEARRKHHDTGSAFFLQLGVLFSVLLAFVFSETWGEYNTASQAINDEVSALHGAAVVANTLPPAQAQAMEHAILDYTNKVAFEEWPAMADRHSSPAAVRNVTIMLQTAARLDVSKPRDVNNQGHILSLLTDAHSQRETRIYQMEQGLPKALWLVLLTYTLVLIACMVMAGVETAVGHIVFAGAFAGCIAMVLVVVRMLDYPFEGALALDNADFLKVSREVVQLMGSG